MDWTTAGNFIVVKKIKPASDDFVPAVTHDAMQRHKSFNLILAIHRFSAIQFEAQIAWKVFNFFIEFYEAFVAEWNSIENS